jgi:hypothetical protein
MTLTLRPRLVRWTCDGEGLVSGQLYIFFTCQEISSIVYAIFPSS